MIGWLILAGVIIWSLSFILAVRVLRSMSLTADVPVPIWIASALVAPGFLLEMVVLWLISQGDRGKAHPPTP